MSSLTSEVPKRQQPIRTRTWIEIFPPWAFGITACLALGVITYKYIVTWQIGFSSDTALIGLMAKSILTRSELPIFVWSVGYQGLLLEAYPTALFFHVFGVHPIVLNLTPAIYLWLALGIWTLNIARVFSPLVASMTLLATVLSVPTFYHLNVRTWPNFPETLALGGLLYLFIQLVFNKTWRGVWAGAEVFALGCIAGLGMYTFSIFSYYLFVLLLWLALLHYQQELSHGFGRFAVSWLLPWRRLKTYELPCDWLWRWPCNILGMFALTTLIVGVVTLKHSEKLLFFGRTIKWNPILLSAIGAFVLIIPRLSLEVVGVLRRSTPMRRLAANFILGYLIGYAPALYFKLVLGGSSVKRAFASGALEDLVRRGRLLVDFYRTLLHFNADGASLLPEFVGTLGLLAIMAFLAQAAIAVRRVVDKQLQWPPFTLLYALLLPATAAIFFVSRSVVDFESLRYLIFVVPIYALALSWAAHEAWRKSTWLRPIAALGYLGALWLGAGSIRQDLATVPTIPYEIINKALGARGITFGYADYWLAYGTTFLANERLVLEPIYSNYSPHYGQQVRSQQRIAYLDYSPPRISSVGGRIKIKDQEYVIVETAQISASVVLQVLDKSDPIFPR